jgi:uncharacterized protein (TIGR02145 family)
MAVYTDRDGNVYHVVRIGNKEWLVENLKTTHYKNGDAIPLVTDPVEWALAGDANCDVYGALYNWYAATYNIGGASIAPDGWHLPTIADWEALLMYLYPEATNGWDNEVGVKLKSIGLDFWSSPNAGATDEYGFNAKGSGVRGVTFEGGVFVYWGYDNVKYVTGFHCAGDYYVGTNLIAIAAHLSFDSRQLMCPFDGIPIASECKRSGIPIRLIKNNSTNPVTMTDYDGNIYSTVKIGNQVWMAENLKVEHFNDGTLIPIVQEQSTWIALSTAAMCYYDNEVCIKDAYCWYNNLK